MGDDLAQDAEGLAMPADDVDGLQLPADPDGDERSQRPDGFISGPEAGVPVLGRTEEEMSSGVVWAVIFAIAFAIWWFTRSTGGQRTASSGGGTSSRAKADAEEMRRKRLEALGARGGASQASASSATGSEEGGLRQRTAAGSPGAAAAKAQEEEKESPGNEAPSVEIASRDTETTKREAASPSGARKEGAVVAPGPSTFVAQVRGILCGVSSAHKVEGLHSGMTVRELHEKVTAAFGPEAVGARLRIHANGQELSKMDRALGSAGVVAGSHLQVMFINTKTTPAKPPAVASEKPQSGSTGNSATASAEATQRTASNAAPVASASSATSAVLPEHKAEDIADIGPFSIRVQGSFKGHTTAVIEGLVASMTVAGLQDRIVASFEATDTGLRLFFMGKELKDPRARLGLLGLKEGSTLNALFASPVQGQPSQPQASNAAPAATGTSTLADTSSVNANLAAAAAQVTPEAAWEAMAAVEEQLSRADDPTAAEPVRQAAAMLKQLLLTATHDSNPALLQFAQMANPDLVKIWAFEPTRTHLAKLLTSGSSSQGSTSSST